MWLYHNNVLQISGALETADAELKRVIDFFSIEKPKGWKIDVEGKLAFRFGGSSDCSWHSAERFSNKELIQKILDYLHECANDGFLLRWIPQGGYAQVNRICGEPELVDFGWDGGFTIEPWAAWKGRVFRFSYALENTPLDEILVFIQGYLGLLFNGEIYPLPGGGFALGRYSREECKGNPLCHDNEAELEMIAGYMKRLLPEQQEIKGVYCDEESVGFMLEYVSGQTEAQDMLLVLPYVCFCHK